MRRTKEATVLLEVSRLESSGPGAKKSLQQLLQKLEHLLVSDAVMLWIFNAREIGVPAFMSTGLDGASSPNGQGKAFVLPVSRELIDANTVIVSEELAQDSRITRPDSFVRTGFTSAMGVSLFGEGQSQGVLFLFTRKRRVFKPTDIALLQALGDALALHIRGARLERKAAKLAAQLEKATRDRMDFMSLLSRELRTPLTIVLGHAAMIHDGMLGQINPMQESGLEAIMRSSRDVLTKVKEGLEQRVVERTAELSKNLAVLKEENIQRRRMERELRRSREQLRELSRRVLSAQEEERRRIAREVHDELGQALTALKIDLTWINQRPQEDVAGIQPRTAKMIKLIDRTIREVRRIARELRPGVLDDLGLVAAIEWQTQEFQSRTGIKCHPEISPDIDIPDPACSTAIFRIFQEALTNVARHAHATEVNIKLLTHAGQLYLEVTDNGRGIEERSIKNTKSFGLVGMRERVLPWGGGVTIGNAKGGGTAVEVKIPLRSKVMRDTVRRAK